MFAPAYRDPVSSRVAAVAAAQGLRVVPAIYSSRLLGGMRTETVDIVPDGSEGPFVVRRLLMTAAAVLQAADTEVQVQSGGRRLTDGAVRLTDLVAAAYPDDNSGQVAIDLPAPVVVLRGDTLSVTFRSDTADTVAAAAVYAVGSHVRHPDGQRVTAPADAWARQLRAEGEFYALGVVLAAAGKDSVNVSSRMLAQRIGVVCATNAATCLVEMGNYTITPPTGMVSPSLNTSGAVWLDDVRHVVSAGDRISLTSTAAARVVVVGRREVC